jgi:hypothetical protein
METYGISRSAFQGRCRRGYNLGRGRRFLVVSGIVNRRDRNRRLRGRGLVVGPRFRKEREDGVRRRVGD